MPRVPSESQNNALSVLDSLCGRFVEQKKLADTLMIRMFGPRAYLQIVRGGGGGQENNFRFHSCLLF